MSEENISSEEQEFINLFGLGRFDSKHVDNRRLRAEEVTENNAATIVKNRFCSIDLIDHFVIHGKFDIVISLIQTNAFNLVRGTENKNLIIDKNHLDKFINFIADKLFDGTISCGFFNRYLSPYIRELIPRVYEDTYTGSVPQNIHHFFIISESLLQRFVCKITQSKLLQNIIAISKDNIVYDMQTFYQVYPRKFVYYVGYLYYIDRYMFYQILDQYVNIITFAEKKEIIEHAMCYIESDSDGMTLLSYVPDSSVVIHIFNGCRVINYLAKLYLDDFIIIDYNNNIWYLLDQNISPEIITKIIFHTYFKTNDPNPIYDDIVYLLFSSRVGTYKISVLNSVFDQLKLLYYPIDLSAAYDDDDDDNYLNLEYINDESIRWLFHRVIAGDIIISDIIIDNIFASVIDDILFTDIMQYIRENSIKINPELQLLKSRYQNFDDDGEKYTETTHRLMCRYINTVFDNPNIFNVKFRKYWASDIISLAENTPTKYLKSLISIMSKHGFEISLNGIDLSNLYDPVHGDICIETPIEFTQWIQELSNQYGWSYEYYDIFMENLITHAIDENIDISSIKLNDSQQNYYDKYHRQSYLWNKFKNKYF